MLWALLKVLVFVAIAAAVAFGAAWIIDTPGHVVVAFGDREFSVTPIGALLGVIVLIFLGVVLLKLLGLAAACVRFLLGDETAVSRYFSKSRERRGFGALSDGMMALAAGDAKTATRQAQKAEKLLARPDMTQLLKAQAAEMSGDRARAIDGYKALLPYDRTRPVGIQGLMRLKIEEGDTDTAMALAKKAFALRPDNERVLRTLFDLQTRAQDWSGARETLNAEMHARVLPRDVGVRRDAVLSLADARAALSAGDTVRGSEAALQANRLAPTLVPAAVLAAQVQTERGSKRKASKLLTSTWAAAPHPELAAAFALIEPDESPSSRRRRFAALVGANPADPESRLLEAELALAAEDFPAARKALGDLAETQPTTRTLALMAAIERGQGAPDQVVRGWLAKAISASRGPQWICEKCNHVHAAWAPVCESCGAFDTLAWRTPAHPDEAGVSGATLLPLVVGEPPAEDAAPNNPDVASADPEVEDAVVASAADQARVAGAN